MEAWTAAIQEQRHLNNALKLWKRFADKNVADLVGSFRTLSADSHYSWLMTGCRHVQLALSNFWCMPHCS